MMDDGWLKKRRMTFILFTIETLFLGCEYGVTVVNLWIYITKMVKPDNPVFLYSFISVVYLMSAAIFSVVFGRIADGTRHVRLFFFLSNSLFVVGNLIYMLPFSYWCLLIGRILAGSGHGIRAVITGEIARCYHYTEILKKLTIIGSAYGTGFMTAPAINMLTQYLTIKIGNLQITFANASGIYMSVLFLITQLLAFFMVHDLSKEYDMKSEKAINEGKELLSETNESIEMDEHNEQLLTDKKVDKSNQKFLVLWLVKKLFSYCDISLLLTLQFSETFFIYSFEMCHPMILLGVLKWTLFSYNLLIFAAGIVVIIPCFVFIYLEVSDKTIYRCSVFGAFGFCVLQAIQIIWAKHLLSPTGNIIISVVYVLFWVQGNFLREVFMTGFLARMVSTCYQSSTDGIRLGISRLGAVVALSSAPFALKIIDRIGLVYIIIQATVGIFLIARHRTLMTPKVIIT